jgi:hypothetical protein
MIHTIFSVILLLFLLLYVHICTYEASRIFKFIFPYGVGRFSSVLISAVYSKIQSYDQKIYFFRKKFLPFSVFSLCAFAH